MMAKVGIAAKRFIVVDKVHDRFLELFVKRMAAPKLGDCLNRTLKSVRWRAMTSGHVASTGREQHRKGRPLRARRR